MPSWARIRDEIKPDKAGVSSEIKQGVAPHEGSNTTHFSIIDNAGNAVSLTYTLNDWFGAKVVASGTGVLMNDEMDDFAPNPGAANADGAIQGDANAIAAAIAANRESLNGSLKIDFTANPR